MDETLVGETAIALRGELVFAGYLPPVARAVQAIAFDKTPDTNWKVTWHQDLMFPFQRRVRSDEFILPSVKHGVDYARPPRDVLDNLLAVRLHLDDCDETNGPLRVSPGTHLLGIIPSAEIGTTVSKHGETSCIARTGDAVLLRPLLLHASSQASAPKHRRVIHFVYHSGDSIAERWHRSL
ncbi:MAG: phytanoyl-CoA dioxygenase family protein [Opitutae bacterium]|nr:phytanoyl-CoA dioxygenase family protein [Opitutae bacterium]